MDVVGPREIKNERRNLNKPPPK